MPLPVACYIHDGEMMDKLNAFLEGLGDEIEDVEEGQSFLAIVKLMHK